MSYGHKKGTSSNEDVPLCGRRESNPYALRHQILSLACLPISTRPRFGTANVQHFIVFTNILEAEAESDTETHCQVLVFLSEPVPEFEAVVVVGLGWGSYSVAASNPEVSEETSVHILISYCSQQRSHVCQSPAATDFAVIIIMGVDELWTKIKAHEGPLVSIRSKELVTVPYGKSHRVVLILVTTCTDETGA